MAAIHLFMHSSIHPSIHPAIHPCIHSLTHHLGTPVVFRGKQTSRQVLCSWERPSQSSWRLPTWWMSGSKSGQEQSATAQMAQCCRPPSSMQTQQPSRTVWALVWWLCARLCLMGCSCSCRATACLIASPPDGRFVQLLDPSPTRCLLPVCSSTPLPVRPPPLPLPVAPLYSNQVP